VVWAGDYSHDRFEQGEVDAARVALPSCRSLVKHSSHRHSTLSGAMIGSRLWW